MTLTELDITPETKIEAPDQLPRNHRRQARVVVLDCGGELPPVCRALIEDKDLLVEVVDVPDALSDAVVRDEADVVVVVPESEEDLTSKLVSSVAKSETQARSLPFVIVQPVDESYNLEPLREGIDGSHPTAIEASTELDAAQVAYEAAAAYRFWPAAEVA